MVPHNKAFDRCLACHLVSPATWWLTRHKGRPWTWARRGATSPMSRPTASSDTDGIGIPARHPTYVDMRRVGGGRGQKAAHTGHLGSLVRLAGAHVSACGSQLLWSSRMWGRRGVQPPGPQVGGRRPDRHLHPVSSSPS